MTEEKSDIEKLVPEKREVTINGVDVTVEPLENQKTLEAAMEAEKRGQEDVDFFLHLIAETLNMNEEFDGVTLEDVKTSRGNLLPLLQAVQEVNGLQDFSDEKIAEQIQ